MRTAAFAGLTVGAISGILLLEWPPLGLLILVAYVVLARVARQALAGLGGSLIGVGAVWLVLFGRVKLSCDGTGPGGTCESPGIDAALLVALAVLLSGIGSWLLAARRARSG